MEITTQQLLTKIGLQAVELDALRSENAQLQARIRWLESELEGRNPEVEGSNSR